MIHIANSIVLLAMFQATLAQIFRRPQGSLFSGHHGFYPLRHGCNLLCRREGSSDWAAHLKKTKKRAFCIQMHNVWVKQLWASSLALSGSVNQNLRMGFRHNPRVGLRLARCAITPCATSPRRRMGMQVVLGLLVSMCGSLSARCRWGTNLKKVSILGRSSLEDCCSKEVKNHHATRPSMRGQ